MKITIRDTPRPQGSKRVFRNGGMKEQSPGLESWREAVKAAALAEMEQYVGGTPLMRSFPAGQGVKVRVLFTFPRPKAHYRTGRHAHLLRPDAPSFVTTKPDLDKIVRSLFDGLTAAGVWHDDSQVVELEASKMYTTSTPTTTVWITAWGVLV